MCVCGRGAAETRVTGEDKIAEDGFVERNSERQRKKIVKSLQMWFYSFLPLSSYVL